MDQKVKFLMSMAQKYAVQTILLTYVFLCVCFLCAGTSSLVQDTQSQTQLVWTSSPSFQHTLRTQNRMQMRVRYTVFDTHTRTIWWVHWLRKLANVWGEFCSWEATLVALPWLVDSSLSPDHRAFVSAASSCPHTPRLTWWSSLKYHRAAIRRISECSQSHPSCSWFIHPAVREGSYHTLEQIRLLE